MENEQKKQDTRLTVLEWYDALVFALVVIVLLFIFVVRLVMVSGPSMKPTLHGGDHLAVQSSFYTPQNGDVIVIDAYISYGKPLVKRIIGMGGDVIDISKETGLVSVNGKQINEPYTSALTSCGEGMVYPVTVPEGKIFVMGDNRPESLDSRDASLGFIDKRDILGKVLARITPLNAIGKIT